MPISFFENVLKSLDVFPVLGDTYAINDYIPLDLSVDNPDLQTVNVSSSDDLEVYIWKHIETNKAKIAYGGYIEKRGIYNRSKNFNQNNPETERNIHLGIDLWIEASRPIYAPLEGELHSFKNNPGFGNYGPTLILKHSIDSLEFYTLYGHLSTSSLYEIRVGEKVQKGQQIATLGTAEVNGDYPPHLHFQIILDMQDFIGDYPGVSNQKDLDFYRNNCPDPKNLLVLK
ncbi:MAG: peptidoglycan DD-metalloendopeptidase family protein [Winogradskyella sp.]|uniref:peptidoglycan DD-metalloendopeptidase family protein n=1 Tax=Winogradskyella sp. TaxID=1883156 RepID=UPI0017AF6919|nr:peptidoglycan DD-metalloendopeptidase family protein [Winogradskyella sp.]MBT8245966.1 peptidoglycan DD-metalloendopeptidase family protein [Winogradskyella sp.]NNK23255.1 peptidoglycan DD-metalloendopeptidase family protein [Winogradskyella sp.]